MIVPIIFNASTFISKQPIHSRTMMMTIKKQYYSVFQKILLSWKIAFVQPKAVCCCWYLSNILKIFTVSRTGRQTSAERHLLCYRNWCLFYYLFSKISTYSPSDGGKLNDKAMQRRSNSLFDPKATIALLKENRPAGAAQTEQDRIDLVQRYLDVSVTEHLNKLL